MNSPMMPPRDCLRLHRLLAADRAGAADAANGREPGAAPEKCQTWPIRANRRRSPQQFCRKVQFSGGYSEISKPPPPYIDIGESAVGRFSPISKSRLPWRYGAICGGRGDLPMQAWKGLIRAAAGHANEMPGVDSTRPTRRRSQRPAARLGHRPRPAVAGPCCVPTMRSDDALKASRKWSPFEGC
jgi:hypothetical protein